MKNLFKSAWFPLLEIFGLFGRRIGVSNLNHYISATPKAFPLRIREIIDASTLINPLKNQKELPSIEIAIPSTSKDLPYLVPVIQSAIKNSVNPISRIKVVVPRSELDEFDFALRDEVFGMSVEVIDEELLLGDLTQLCNSVAPTSRRGWLIQQIVKYSCVLNSDSDGVLIIDSDTLLTVPRIWIDNNKTQILMISHEYHLPYQLHYLSFRNKIASLGNSESCPRVSYVTHHQLMQPVILREMLGGDSRWPQGLESWINSINFDSQSPACEYHCYGTFLELHKRDAFRFARWGNVAVSRSNYEKFILRLSKVEQNQTFRKICSFSVHAYL